MVRIMNKTQQHGFTLVEMSVVLVLIAILLGGMLKFGEMIDAARVKSVGIQWDNVKSAVSAFKGKYGELPGDLRDANQFISNLTPPGGPVWEDDYIVSAPPLDEDRIICYFCRNLNGGAAAANHREYSLVWKQLYASKMLNMMTDSNVTVDAKENRYFSKMKGLEFFLMTDTDSYVHGAGGTATMAAYDGTINDNRLYLYLLKAQKTNPRRFTTNVNLVNETGYGITGKQAYEIDKKFDDGADIQECDSDDDPCRTGSVRYGFDTGPGVNPEDKKPFGEKPVVAMQLLTDVR